MRQEPLQPFGWRGGDHAVPPLPQWPDSGEHATAPQVWRDPDAVKVPRGSVETSFREDGPAERLRPPEPRFPVRVLARGLWPPAERGDPVVFTAEPVIHAPH